MNAEKNSNIVNLSKAHKGKITTARLVFLVVVSLVYTACTIEKNEPVDLLNGARREIARIEQGHSLTWQKTLIFDKVGQFNTTIRIVFNVTDISPFASLTLEKPLELDTITLNGNAIPVPLEGMCYKKIPAIPVSMLHQGENVLTVSSWRVDVKKNKNGKTEQNEFQPDKLEADGFPLHLFGLPASELAIQSGPILGYADYRSFTVTCRLNMPAQAVLQVGGKSYCSLTPALIHTFTASGLEPDNEYAYTIIAQLPGKKNILTTTGSHIVRTLPVNGKLVFAALGDSRTYPQDWAKVADAVVRAKPALVIFSGDMVSNGRIDHQWDEDYFGAAKEFFATIPCYAVIGNHEVNCPLFLELFKAPNNEKNWAQTIGTVLLIGIDGDMNWASGGALNNWLENVLANSRAKFIFLATHYPAWSSGTHGGVDVSGRLCEHAMRQMQEIIMPMLAKYDATAMIAGHDHFYERSEPTNGVTMIISGGAGAPLRDMSSTAIKQNPYSKVFAKRHHYCLFTVDGDMCAMKACTPEGELLDTREWKARELSKYPD